MHALLLAELNGADAIDWSRALIDASFAKAPEGGEATGPNPTDRSKSGSKHHVLTDAHGIPLNATVTAANVHDVTQVLDLLVNKPAVGGKVPLVRGADHFLVACLRTLAASAGSPHGDSRGIPPFGLFGDLFEVFDSMSSRKIP